MLIPSPFSAHHEQAFMGSREGVGRGHSDTWQSSWVEFPGKQTLRFVCWKCIGSGLRINTGGGMMCGGREAE